MTDEAEVKELLKPPVITPATYLKIFPVSRNTTYEALAAGQIEAMKVGKKYLIITAPIRKRLGI